MKKLFIAIIATVSAGVFAAGSNGYYPTEANTWDEIQNNYNYRIEVRFPSVQLDNGGSVFVTGLCFNGANLETVNELTRCVEYRRLPRGERECARTEAYTGYAELEGERTVCAQWRNLGRGERECARYEDVPYTIELDHSVPVYSKRALGRGEYKYDLLFEKGFTIPNCQ